MPFHAEGPNTDIEEEVTLRRCFATGDAPEVEPPTTLGWGVPAWARLVELCGNGKQCVIAQVERHDCAWPASAGIVDRPSASWYNRGTLSLAAVRS